MIHINYFNQENNDVIDYGNIALMATINESV